MVWIPHRAYAEDQLHDPNNDCKCMGGEVKEVKRLLRKIQRVVNHTRPRATYYCVLEVYERA